MEVIGQDELVMGIPGRGHIEKFKDMDGRSLVRMQVCIGNVEIWDKRGSKGQIMKVLIVFELCIEYRGESMSDLKPVVI